MESTSSGPDNNIISLEQVPHVFFECEDPEECILEVFSHLPSAFDPNFQDELNKQIEIAENSISVVSEELTKKVSSSQLDIFDATEKFIQLQKHVLESTDFIKTMRQEIDIIQDKTLDPILSIYTNIRNIRRDNQNLLVLHFAKSMGLIGDVLNSKNFIQASFIYNKIKNVLEQDEVIYTENTFSSISGIRFPKFPEIIENTQKFLTIGELKELGCTQGVIDLVNHFPSKIVENLTNEVRNLATEFNEESYAEVIIGFCLTSNEPPIATTILDLFTTQLHNRALAYFETLSNDLETLFRFMETNCAHIERFNEFVKFHQTYQNFDSIKDLLNNASALEYDVDITKQLEFLTNSFNASYNRFCHAAESNVIQFLSRINCTSLDALSFIKLAQSLREFSKLLSCSGIKDWLSITSSEYMKKYTSAAIHSARAAAEKDSWAPNSIDAEFLQLVQTKPECEEDVFNFSAEEFDHSKCNAPSSAFTTVRILHSLVCLSLELDPSICLNLAAQVVAAYIVAIISIFASPFQLLVLTDDGQVLINPRLVRSFNQGFVTSLKQILRILGQVQQSEQRTVESSEAQLVQMITATEGLRLVRWYLSSIRQYMMDKTNGPLKDRLSVFFETTFSTMFPTVRMNLCALCARNFLSMKTLKYQIIATDWNVREITIECHPFVATARKAYEALDRVLKSYQLSADAYRDVWYGTWIRTCHVLNGAFGAVRSCNSNGRSLMLGDTRAVAAAFTAVSGCETDMTPIMEFVNAYFFKPDEFLRWCERNIAAYKVASLQNLIKTGFSSKISSREAKELLQTLDAIIESQPALATRKK